MAPVRDIAATSIPTASEIAALEKDFKEKREIAIDHALSEINRHIETLAAIGEHYTLAKTSDVPKKKSARTVLHCSNCGAPGHRKPQCAAPVDHA